MIPKVIHYCWFGDQEIPEFEQKCIESWKKQCPDFEICEWNEKNYDVTKNKYMKQAYQAGKWSFVTDVARLDIIFRYGGIYLDTDVELIRPIDDLLEEDVFMGVEGNGLAATGLGFGAVKESRIIEWLLSEVYGTRDL